MTNAYCLSKIQKEFVTVSSLNGHFKHFEVNLKSKEELEFHVIKSKDASPGNGQMRFVDTHFLIAAYNIYGRPYVWLKEKPETNVSSQSSTNPKSSARNDTTITRKTDSDKPIQLNSCNNWPNSNKQTAEIHLWQIISELLEISCAKELENPFAIDIGSVSELEAINKLLTSAAIMEFLGAALTCMNLKNVFVQIFDDFDAISRIHFTTLRALTETNDLPAVKMVKERLGTLQRATSTGTPILTNWGNGNQVQNPFIPPEQNRTGSFDSQMSGSPPSHGGSYGLSKLGPLFKGRERAGSFKEDAENPYKFLMSNNVA